MENGPFEDVFPIENGDIPASYVSLPEGSSPSKVAASRCCCLPGSSSYFGVGRGPFVGVTFVLASKKAAAIFGF